MLKYRNWGFYLKLNVIQYIVDKYKFITSFSSRVRPVISDEKDKYLALASLQEIGKFIPNINTAENPDLLPIAFNACVINRVNKNKDVIDTKTALAMYKNFALKSVNIEHNRKSVIGTIVHAGFSEFGTNKPLSELDVIDKKEPFNVVLGAVIWKLVCPELAELIEESNDEDSDKYLSISASWELGFTDYNIILLDGGEKNIINAKELIDDPKKVEEIKDKLTSLGGTGKYNDLFAYRMPIGSVVPLAIGLTEKPAADVKGIAVPDVTIAPTSPIVEKAEDDTLVKGQPKLPIEKDGGPGHAIKNQEQPMTKETIDKFKNTFETPIGPVSNSSEENNKNLINNIEIISQRENSNVNQERSKLNMKITCLADITDENLKQCSASIISDFIKKELEKGNETWTVKNNEVSTKLNEANEKNQTLAKAQDDLAKQVKTMEATINSLTQDKVEREKVDTFNARMEEVVAAYTLDEELSTVVAEEIKAIASDEDFKKWLTKAKILFKGFAKKDGKKDKNKEDKKNDEDEKDGEEDEDEEEMKADDMSENDMSEAKKKKKKKEEAKAAVEDALDNGKDENGNAISNQTNVGEVSLKEKYKNAFAKENVQVTW